MGFFDDLGDAFTTVAGEVFNGVNTATRVVFDAHREILGELGINKDSFANQVLDQWQEQQRVALGTVLKVAGDGLNLVATGASAVDKGFNQYLAIASPLAPIVQQVQLQTAEILHQTGLDSTSVDKAGELALSAVLQAVKQAGMEAAAAVKTVDNIISGDAKLVDLVVATAKAQNS